MLQKGRGVSSQSKSRRGFKGTICSNPKGHVFNDRSQERHPALQAPKVGTPEKKMLQKNILAELTDSCPTGPTSCVLFNQFLLRPNECQ